MATGYPRKQSSWTIFDYNYVFDINNIWSTHPEEGLTEGLNVEDSVLKSIYLNEIYRN